MANSGSSFHPPFESAREHIRAQPAPALLAAPRGSDNEKWQLRSSSGKIGFFSPAGRAAAQKELGSAPRTACPAAFTQTPRRRLWVVVRAEPAPWGGSRYITGRGGTAGTSQTEFAELQTRKILCSYLGSRSVRVQRQQPGAWGCVAATGLRNLVRAGEVMGNAGCFPSFSFFYFIFFVLGDASRRDKGCKACSGTSQPHRRWLSLGSSCRKALGAVPVMGCSVGSVGSLQPFHGEVGAEKQRNFFHFLPLFH